jgi:hypothetical protein
VREKLPRARTSGAELVFAQADFDHPPLTVNAIVKEPAHIRAPCGAQDVFADMKKKLR